MLEVQPGRFYKVKNVSKKSSANDHYNMIVVENNEGDLEELLFTDSDLIKATVRRRKNEEDVPRYSVVAPEGGFVYAFGLAIVGVVGGLLGYLIKDLNLF